MGIQRYVLALMLLLSLATPKTAVAADAVKVRFAYLQVIDLLPYFIANKKGYLKEEGLDVEPIVVAGGPAVLSAIAGGSADFGFTGTVSMIMARLQGLPFKFFSGLNFERWPDDVA